MDSLRAFRGKTGSLSTPSFSIKYNPEADEIEEVKDIITVEKTVTEEPQDEETITVSQSSISDSGPTEKKGKDSPFLSRSTKRAGSLEEGASSPEHPWRFISQIKQITKTVEEKLEGIKSDRLKQKSSSKNKSSPSRKVGHHSSISDSEERSETSSSIKESSSPEKSISHLIKQRAVVYDEDEDDSEDDERAGGGRGGVGGGRLSDGSTSGGERATTPQITEIDISDSPTPSIVASYPNKSFHFWHRSKELGHDYKVLHRRKPRKRSEGPVEIGVEALDADFMRGPGAPVLSKPTPVSPSSSSAPAEVPRQASLITAIVRLSDPLVKHRYFRYVHFCWNWWVLVFPISVALFFRLFEPSTSVYAFLIGAVITVEINFFLSKIQSFMSLDDADLETAPGSGVLHDTIPLFNDKTFFQPKRNPDLILHEGWMNEFCDEYNPETYRIAFTSTVYVHLEGSLLRLATPRNKIPKRAFWNEPNYKLLFDLERVYNISNCRVSLLPEGLAHKRWWSKKYPICIALLPNSQIGVRYREKGQITLEDYYPPYSSCKRYSVETGLVFEDSSNVDIKSLAEENDGTDLNNENDKEVGEGCVHPEGQVKQMVGSQLSTPKEGEEKMSSGASESDVKDNIKTEDIVSSTVATDDNDDVDDDDVDNIMNDYVEIPTSLVNRTHLYLFARSDREKEIWFRRFVAASSYTSYTRPYEEEELTIETEFKDAKKQRENTENAYLLFMKKLGQIKTQSDKVKHRYRSKKEIPSGDVWVNALVGRILYDVLIEPYWHEKIKEKIQKKLSAIRLPIFLEELFVSNLEVGDSIPVIERSTVPTINEYGMWIDLDISYKGSFKMTVDTKLNLMKLKTLYNPEKKQPETELGNELEELKKSPSSVHSTPSKPAIFDSSVEDSAESSGDDEPPTGPESGSLSHDHSANSASRPTSSGPKVLSVVDRIAASKYFQQVTDMKYIKKAIEGVSNTNISLLVELKGIIGTLVINLPPPPSDRLWYGFRTKPKIWLNAQPKWGAREINMLNIAGWIEKKLYKEFQKLLVLPNMDDLVIPVMNKDEPS